MVHYIRISSPFLFLADACFGKIRPVLEKSDVLAIVPLIIDGTSWVIHRICYIVACSCLTIRLILLVSIGVLDVLRITIGAWFALMACVGSFVTYAKQGRKSIGNIGLIGLICCFLHYYYGTGFQDLSFISEERWSLLYWVRTVPMMMEGIISGIPQSVWGGSVSITAITVVKAVLKAFLYEHSDLVSVHKEGREVDKQLLVTMKADGLISRIGNFVHYGWYLFSFLAPFFYSFIQKMLVDPTVSIDKWYMNALIRFCLALTSGNYN